MATGSTRSPRWETIGNTTASGGKRRGGRRSRIKPLVLEVLREHGGEMHADEIVSVLRKRGVEMSQKDPKGTVVTALLRIEKETGEVEALGRNRYRANSDAEAAAASIGEFTLGQMPDDGVQLS